MLSELRENRITRRCEKLSHRAMKIADALEKALDLKPKFFQVGARIWRNALPQMRLWLNGRRYL
jgi:hypothetical protein